MRKPNNKYFFTVEGQTEKWYLEWLANVINLSPEACCTVSIDCKVDKNPFHRAKSLKVLDQTEIWHFCDYESDDPQHVKEFLSVIDSMKKAEEIKTIDYKFGYSNLTFDLWMILHKTACNNSIADRKNYLSHINRAYSEKFDGMDEYKEEDNFKRCLSKLTINDVKCAIERAEAIMKHNEDNGYKLQEYKTFHYYKENPSLQIWIAIKKMLSDSGLL